MDSQYKKNLEKIAKCLRLAKSSNPHEAGAALRQAQKLMEKYSITQDQVKMADVNEHAASIGTRNRQTIWQGRAEVLINDAFGTQSFAKLHGNAPTEIIFVGLGTAPTIASYAFSVIHRQLKKERAAYYKKLRGKRINKIRKADLFAVSWLNSVRETVIKFAGQDNELIEKYLEVAHTGLMSFSKKINASPDDYTHIANGARAGRGVTLNHAMDGNTEVKQLR